MTWLTDAESRYGAIAVGLGIGLAAKYGLDLSEGRKLTWGRLMADVLLLGMLGLIAIIVSDWLNLTGNIRVLVGALSAVSSDRLVRALRNRFIQRMVAEFVGGSDTDPRADPKISPDPIDPRLDHPVTQAVAAGMRAEPFAKRDPDLDGLIYRLHEDDPQLGEKLEDT